MNIFNFVADMNCYFSRKPDIVREKRQDPLHCTPPKGSYGQRTVNLAIVINSGGHNIIREDSETVDNSLYVIRFPYKRKVESKKRKEKITYFYNIKNLFLFVLN